MPEYLAPGVFVEEVSYRSKSIAAVATSTTGFVGRAHYGPVQYPDGPTTTEPRLVCGGEAGPAGHERRVSRAVMGDVGCREVVQRDLEGDRLSARLGLHGDQTDRGYVRPPRK
jgi:hypothetical protein